MAEYIKYLYASIVWPKYATSHNTQSDENTPTSKSSGPLVFSTFTLVLFTNMIFGHYIFSQFINIDVGPNSRYFLCLVDKTLTRGHKDQRFLKKKFNNIYPTITRTRDLLDKGEAVISTSCLFIETEINVAMQTTIKSINKVFISLNNVKCL